MTVTGKKEGDMARRSLVLHIGAHKTGTTAIQVYLRRNREALRAIGRDILLPPTPQGKPANWNFMFGIDPGPVFRLKPPALKKMLAQIDGGSDDLILSSEELFFLEPPTIHDFAKALAGRFDRVHLVAYLRRQDRMAISHWQQAARTQQSAVLFGNSAGPLIDLPEPALDYLDYATRLEHWITAFAPGQVTCRIYDRQLLAGGDAVTDFLQVAGLSPLTDKMPGWGMNDALGTETIFFMHELRESGVTQPEIDRILRAKILPEGTSGGLPARAEAEGFMARFAERNARLAEVVGEPVSFSDDFSDYPETAHLPRFTEAQRADVMARMEPLLSQAGTPGAGPASESTAGGPVAAPARARATGRKTILLHVGAHKTGSTTIQQTFYANREILKKNGISYLSANNADQIFCIHFTRRQDYGAIFKPVGGLSPAERVEKRVAEVRRDIETAETDVIALSSENFSVLSKSGLIRLRDFLAPYGDISVVYFYRDLVPWLASHSQQLAKAGTVDRPLPYGKGITRLYQIPKQLIEVFGAENVTMRNFDDAVKAGLLDTVITGFDVPTMAQMGIEEVRSNEGISAEAVRLFYLYNSFYPMGHPERKPPLVKAIRELPGEKYKIAGITPEEHADYTEKYPEMTSELGLKLAPPEEVPIAAEADAVAARMRQVINQIGAARRKKKPG